MVAGQEPAKLADAIIRHLEGVLPRGYRRSFHCHGPDRTAFSPDPDLSALPIADCVLEELVGAKALRVAMVATIPIGGVFRKHLGLTIMFFLILHLG